MENQGGAFYSEDGSPLVRDCEFTENSAAAGGAFFVLGGDVPLVERCSFHGNSAAGIGGAVGVESGAVLHISDCHFWENTGGAGGAICAAAGSAVISECLIDLNYADFGGAINIMSATRTAIERSIVVGNTATFAGGGIYALYGEDVTLMNCTVADNTCEAMGGGIYSSSTELLMENTIVASSRGNGGIYFESSSGTTIAYNDFWNNEGGDLLGDVPAGLGILTATNANGDSCDFLFNILLDPIFVDPGQENFHIVQNSPCVDAGDPLSPVDPDGTVSDMGALYFDQGFLLWCELGDGEIILQWYPQPGASAYWIYGAPENAWFDPGVDEPYEHRIQVLPEGSDTWASALGIGDPAANWFFLIVAVDQNDQEIRRSNRVAEYDVLWELRTR